MSNWVDQKKKQTFYRSSKWIGDEINHRLMGVIFCKSILLGSLLNVFFGLAPTKDANVSDNLQGND